MTIGTLDLTLVIHSCASLNFFLKNYAADQVPGICCNLRTVILRTGLSQYQAWLWRELENTYSQTEKDLAVILKCTAVYATICWSWTPSCKLRYFLRKIINKKIILCYVGDPFVCRIYAFLSTDCYWFELN